MLRAESLGSRYRTVHPITETAEGLELTMEFNATPLTFMAKVMSVLMKPMMKKMVDLCAKDLDALKAHIEATAR